MLNVLRDESATYFYKGQDQQFDNLIDLLTKRVRTT